MYIREYISKPKRRRKRASQSVLDCPICDTAICANNTKFELRLQMDYQTLPKLLDFGTVLLDSKRAEWIVGHMIGFGENAEIYAASQATSISSTVAIKIVSKKKIEKIKQ